MAEQNRHQAASSPFGAPLSSTKAQGPSKPLPPGYQPRPVITPKKKAPPPTLPPPEEGPTYWTTGRWGQVANNTANQSKPVSSDQQKKGSKYYQTPGAPIPQPDAQVFHSLNDLETLMKATLGALANFNEDEKMILLRQFRKESETARQRGEYSPPGLLSTSQFRHAFKKLGVRVSEDQANGLFIKYGCDSQGLLPYDMFATRLLSSPARLLALEPEQKGAYKAGKDASFKGKILYRHCHKPVFPPSAWDGSAAIRSSKKPKAGLKLEFVYGYPGHQTTCNNLFWTADYKIVYYLAAVGIVYDPVSHTQQFYEGHHNDIRAMALHPNRYLVATGQMADANEGPEADFPYVCIWDTRDVTGTNVRINFKGEAGPGERADQRRAKPSMIVQLEFSPNGERLVVVLGDDKHTVEVWDWREKKKICWDVGYAGVPPMIYGVVWNKWLSMDQAQGGGAQGGGAQGGGAGGPDRMFVTYGFKHMKIWTLAKDPKSDKESYASVMAKFRPKAEVADVTSAIFINSGTIVTGALDGTLLLFDVSGVKGPFGSCIQVVRAHEPGPTAPSMHNGLPQLQGVRALCIRGPDSALELCSGGSDGLVICWSIEGGQLRQLKRIQLQEVGESQPCSFRSLDASPGSITLIAGNNRCEIWEISKDIPEVLIQGHTDDVYAIDFHPKKPYKFATACDSSNVFLWNAKRRQLMAKVSIGVAARAVCFSPNGAHLAVGTNTGVIKVLLVENLAQKVAEMHHSKEELAVVRYSPDGTKLAVGSHDNYIYFYNVLNGYSKIATFKGHSSYITHLDWSSDSKIVQSNCGAYELLYSEASTGKQVTVNQRDTIWATWTCTLGFDVMGIWRRFEDGTDINDVCRSNRIAAFADSDPLAGEPEVVVAAHDDGKVRLLSYPAVVEEAPCRAYVGHCSHVAGIRFSPDNVYVMSMGGDDRSAMQWRVLPQANDDIVVEKPLIDQHQVYLAPKRAAVENLSLNPVYNAPVREVGPGGPLGPGGLLALDKLREDDEKRRREEAERKRLEGLVRYEVTTVTADVRGAGTDCGVMLVVYGSLANSKQVMLESGPNNFQRGKTDVFNLDWQDLGELKSLTIGHDEKGSLPRWMLESLTITNKKSGQSWLFPCGQWFARDVGDKQVMRSLFPQGSDRAKAQEGLRVRRYKVEVKTSDIRGAGTDANVYLNFLSDQGTGKDILSEAFKLDNSANNFERNQIDIFEIDAKIGQIKAIQIGHDNTGLGASWHLDQVAITSPGMTDMLFVAKRWLDVNEADGQTSCILFPFGAKDVPRLHKYKIDVTTSDIRGAGTDANVSITLFGSNGTNSGKLKLASSKNDFERGNIDTFFKELLDLGDIPEVEVEHDNAGVGPGWHLQGVVVTDETAVPPKRFSFPCDRWLAVDEDDKQIKRRLKALDRNSDITNYTVMTKTSDIRGAGTDADVYIFLCGVRGGKEMWSPQIKLDNSKNNFERNMEDTFNLMKQMNLGELNQIKIGHNNSGIGPGWHLDHVEVTDESSGERYFFPCGQWLDRTEGDRLIERILKVSKRDLQALTSDYNIVVHTSDLKFAGTDANVHIQIMGEHDGKEIATPVVKLTSSKNNFERNSKDSFTLKNLPAITRMHSIRIGHDNSGIGPGWHLKQVEVFCITSQDKAIFYYNGWLDVTEPPNKIEVEITREGEQPEPPNQYDVFVLTSDCRGAGTDANVSIIMYGDLHTSPILPLSNSKNNFERNQRDVFLVETKSVGKLQKLQVSHDGSGLGPAWHLNHIEIVDRMTRESYYFLADRWMDKKDGTNVVMLEPASRDSDKQVYQVVVTTGDKRGSGTDADISVILFGDKAVSPEMKLDNSANNFERSQRDEFNLTFGNLGEIQKIEIGFATQQTVGGKLGSLFGKNWQLQSVEVNHPNTHDRKFFFYDDWISNEKRRVQLVPNKDTGNNNYRVVVRTSDLRGAGTDSNVTLCIFGQKDGKICDTGTHKLDNAHNNFERNQIDTFFIKSKDVGEISHVTVTSDGSGFGAAWHLESIEVTGTNNSNVPIVFPCQEWLDPKDPMSLQKTLLPAGVTNSSILMQYTLKVYTSDVRGAGTDDDIFIQLWGDKSHTAPLKLDTSANNFERNMTDVFNPKAADVGELQYIIVKKAGNMATGSSFLGGDWHLQQVEVHHPGLKKTYFFFCNEWLKGACEKKLEVGHGGAGLTRYKVVVVTADERGAGTDANVKMVLFGEKGDTGERKLDTSANNFERNQSDIFLLESPHLGRLQKIKIWHDNWGLGPAWKLARIEVTNTSDPSEEFVTFPANRWLDKQHGLEAILTPDRDGDGQGDALEGGVEVEYNVAVHTSDIRFAGTDSNVFLEMHGSKGSMGERKLEDRRNLFERGAIDNFKFQASDIGDIEKIIVRHDNSGLGPDWHLKQIVVYSNASGRSYFFACDKWLKKEGSDLSGCRKELTATSAENNGPINYQVEVVTSDLRGAGTDADVMLVIAGDKGDTGERVLTNTSHNLFERGKKDIFVVTAPSVGALQWIKVRSTGSGLGAPWHLDRIIVTSLTESLPFPFRNWIDQKNGLEHTIWPDRDGDGMGDVGTMGDRVKYLVTTHTSDIRGAGTDANVTIEIHGDKSFIGSSRLETHGNNFERGQKDEFEVTGPDIGQIQRIVIAHDNSGIGAPWHLAQVTIFHPLLQQMFVFPCDDWLQYTKEKGVEGCRKELFTGAAAAASGLVTLQVLVKTADVRGAGTDSDTWITVYGTKGDSGERELFATGKNCFERNKLDTFILKVPDIGEPIHIKMKLAGNRDLLGSAAWCLDKVDVISSATNQSYNFPFFGGWFDSKSGWEHVIYRDGVQGAHNAMQEYKVTVFTSDIRGAGTSANVFIELHGDKGSIGANHLESGRSNFDRNSRDVFVVKGTDINDVKKVVIWHDNAGIGAAWHLASVEVFNPATQKTYFFECNQWLEKSSELGDAGCKRELIAGAPGGDGKMRYKVEVKTSDIRGAGTDANVTIQVFGSAGDTGVHELATSRNNFERDQIDTFFFEAPDIGFIQSCIVTCDGSGMGAAWHLDNIVVSNLATGDVVRFIYRSWFDAKEGWTHTLLPEGTTKGQEVLNIVPYKVTVYTSDLRGAGTGGDVYLSMKGSNGGEMGETKLQGTRDSFSRNGVDIFEVPGSDLGRVVEVTVRLHEKGLGAPWHFREIEVLNLRTGALARFEYDSWLEKTKENPTAKVTLKEASSDEARMERKSLQWRIVTQTSNFLGAGTDGAVWLTILGPSGMLGGSPIYLANSANCFERNQIDTFIHEIPVQFDSGSPLSGIALQLEGNMTAGLDWHLDWISVTDVARGHTYMWRCGRWFNSREGMRKEWSVDSVMSGQPLQLELTQAPAGPEKPPGSTPCSGDTFKILVVTSDKYAAGTGATVRLSFTDTAGQVWQPSFPQRKGMFGRHCSDLIETASLFPMGEMVSCRAWLDPATVGMSDSWHLQEIVLTQLPSNRAWKFSLDGWMPKDGAVMSAQVLHDFPLTMVAPDSPDVKKRNKNDQQQMGRDSLTYTVPPVEYGVSIATGNKIYAGTDAMVSMEVVGTWGRATHTFEQSKNLFQKGKTDRFLVRVPECGNLQSVRLWHDGAGFGSDWFVDRVAFDSSSGARWEGEFSCWIKKGEDRSVTKKLILTAGVPPQGPPPPPPPPVAQQAQAPLPPSQFGQLPAMQPPLQSYPPNYDPLSGPEPTTDWLECTAPYAQDPNFLVKFYHNQRTSESVYDKPLEYAAWENMHSQWLAASLKAPIAR